MANVITNRLRVKKEFGKYILNDKGEVDFNILVPMPECLMLGDSGMQEYHIYVYLSNKGQLPDEEVIASMGYFFKNINESYLEKLKSRIPNKMLDEDYARGKQELENFIETGHFDWYSWSLANWGCKWPASDAYIEDTGDDDELEIWFDTPWSPPSSWLEVLAQVKDIYYEFKCTDECYGKGVVDAYAEDGNLYCRELDANEAMKISEELMGELEGEW